MFYCREFALWNTAIVLLVASMEINKEALYSEQPSYSDYLVMFCVRLYSAFIFMGTSCYLSDP